MGKEHEMWLRLYIDDKVGVSFIDSIPHCHTEKCFENKQNPEMWTRFYIEDKVGVSIIDCIPHCHSENALKRRENKEM